VSTLSVRTYRGYGNHIAKVARIVLVVAVIISCGKNNNTAHHFCTGARLTVRLFACVINEVANGSNVSLSVHVRVGVAPAVLSNHCTVIGSPCNGCRSCAVPVGGVWKNLAGHQAHTVTAARAACYTGNPPVVIGYGGNRSGYVRTVVFGGYSAVVINKVSADTAPHVGSNIGVVDVNSAVNYCHNNISRASCYVPRSRQANIHARDSSRC